MAARPASNPACVPPDDDVNPKAPNATRDAERFVVGDDGRVFYTSTHYDSWVLVRHPFKSGVPPTAGSIVVPGAN